MKKKIIAIVAMVLIVVLACSLAACNSNSMFDGSYKKEASKEQATASWDSARVAFGIDVSTLATASSSVAIQGWDGLKVIANSEINYTNIEDGVTYSVNTKASSDSSYLFDGSAMAINGEMTQKFVEGEDKDEYSLKAGVYSKDKTLYANLTVGENALKVKTAISNTALASPITYVSSQFVVDALDNIGDIIGEFSYTELLEEYAGVKAYIDDHGDYNRIKYVFSSEMIAEMFGLDSEDFEKLANLGECYLIIVTDKETGTFQGAKLALNFDYKEVDGDNSSAIVAKTSASIENCKEISESAYPSDLDSYTTPSLTDLINFLADFI